MPVDTWATLVRCATQPTQRAQQLIVCKSETQDVDWRARESAILALGAISEGCHRGLTPYLGELVTMLAPQLNDARPLVRSITCWALSRYSAWLVLAGKQPNSPGQLQLDLVITVRSDELSLRRTPLA